MKTAVTVVNTEQVSMDEYQDVKTSKVFDDNATIGEIKDWILKASKSKLTREKFGISGNYFSNVEE